MTVENPILRTTFAHWVRQLIDDESTRLWRRGEEDHWFSDVVNDLDAVLPEEGRKDTFSWTADPREIGLAWELRAAFDAHFDRFDRMDPAIQIVNDPGWEIVVRSARRLLGAMEEGEASSSGAA